MSRNEAQLCPVCYGKGKYDDKVCHGCQGKGWITVLQDCCCVVPNTIYVNLCPSCHQPAHAPPSTGCPIGFHYNITWIFSSVAHT